MITAHTTAFLLFVICFLALFSHAADSNPVERGRFIRDGDTIVSDRLNFELGFFSLGNSSLRYVGIWYYRIPSPAVIWVANRGNPIADRRGVITIGVDGNLVVLDGESNAVWSSNVSDPNRNSQAILHDDGNLVLSSRRNGETLWQSFEHPTDTFLPGMVVPVSAAAGELRSFISWKSAIDPSPGNFVMGVDPTASPQIVVWEGGKRRWRSGYWDGRIFTGVSNMTGSYLYGFRLNGDNDQRRYFTYTPMNISDKVRFLMGWDGNERQLKWNEGEKKWVTTQTEPYNNCEHYNKCGNFGLCSLDSSPICSCIKGFEPKNWVEWSNGNWSGGCKRRTPLKAQNNPSNGTEKSIGEDGFSLIKCMKLPDFTTLVVDGATSVGTATEDCENHCLPNSNCTAYANIIGIGCMIWYGELVDIQHFENGGNTLFVRLAASDLGNMSKKTKVVVISLVVSGIICLGLCVWLACMLKGKCQGMPKLSLAASCKNVDIPVFASSKSRDISVDFSGSTELSLEGNQLSGPELPFYNFNCIAKATDNFSEENKLGQGGFGPVYKGKLPTGDQIAVKRLSRRSGQGLEEFKNEMLLIAKLQHRNLVRLLGCSIQEEEKLLIYEYMPNKSLDCYLFDPVGQKQLDWNKRFGIIEGIARGLLYLHRDSRLRIIHRDLKASNILLDEKVNPKISDFGLARIFCGNQNEANTTRVVGTYGYMAPEYAMEGLFSVKSDVYSFGVLLLEIVSGRRNTSFRNTDDSSLIGYKNLGHFLIESHIEEVSLKEGLYKLDEFSTDRTQVLGANLSTDSRLYDIDEPALVPLKEHKPLEEFFQKTNSLRVELLKLIRPFFQRNLSDVGKIMSDAWHLWNEHRAMELVDPSIRELTPSNKALRWIHIGMLCVQDYAANRPTMPSVVLMLESDTTSLPLPRQPMISSVTFEDREFYANGLDACSNGLTVTMAVGR